MNVNRYRHYSEKETEIIKKSGKNVRTKKKKEKKKGKRTPYIFGYAMSLILID